MGVEYPNQLDYSGVADDAKTLQEAFEGQGPMREQIAQLDFPFSLDSHVTLCYVSKKESGQDYNIS